MKQLLPVIFLLLLVSCFTVNLHAGSKIADLNNRMTGILVKDQFNPPVASRIYTYSNIAYYEALVFGSQQKSFSQVITGMPNIHGIKTKGGVNHELLAELTYLKLAKVLTYEQREWTDLYNQAFMGVDDMEPVVLDNTVAIADSIVKVFSVWMNADGYNDRLGLKQYQVDKTTPGGYALTPPGYVSPVEPHWGKQRLFVLPNIDDYNSNLKYEYSEDKSSAFYEANLEVYNAAKQCDDDERHTAMFWDCNPVQMTITGHVMQYNYRMTPGSHWISILGIVGPDRIETEQELSATYAILSLAMADAFIVCWFDKYRYNSVRPITYITKHIDASWNSVIMNPSFPEYPSGHSMVSTAAAYILSEAIGDSIAFLDESQVQFGVKTRTYTSFNNAAKEAGYSRVFGGIHYTFAVEDGFTLGDKIGQTIWEKTGFIVR